MRSYIVVKALVLSLGAISVVARSLPEHRSEIKNRTDGGGYGLRNPPTELEAADAKIDTAVSNPTTSEHSDILMPSQLIPLTFLFHPHHGHNHATFIPGIDDLKHRLEGMGLVIISEGMLDEKVYTRTYSITANTTFSMPVTTLEKRDRNVEGGRCTTTCYETTNMDTPVAGDCAIVYRELYKQAIQFSVGPCTSRFPS